MASELILIVDDEASIVDLARLYLEKEGYKVWAIDDGLRALEKIPVLKPALVVLDIMLPGVDGFEVCRRLRVDNPVPILMVTARDDDIDKIIGLEMGADDYVVKPFSPQELVSRVRAVLRRGGSEKTTEGERALEVGGLLIDPLSRSVTLNGSAIELTVKEFDMLYLLARHPRQVFSRDHLLERIWGVSEYIDPGTVTVHVRRLREKIEIDPSKPAQLLTVWGVGYKFEP